MKSRNSKKSIEKTMVRILFLWSKEIVSTNRSPSSDVRKIKKMNFHNSTCYTNKSNCKFSFYCIIFGGLMVIVLIILSPEILVIFFLLCMYVVTLLHRKRVKRIANKNDLKILSQISWYACLHGKNIQYLFEMFIACADPQASCFVLWQNLPSQANFLVNLGISTLFLLIPNHILIVPQLIVGKNWKVIQNKVKYLL